MRHQRKSRRFGRHTAHRLAMFRNMVTSLFLHERILTTLEKAKELRRVAEKLITLGKRGDIAARRTASKKLRTTGSKEGKKMLQEETALRKLFDVLGPRFEKRPGGYTRIIQTGRRLGDNAAMAFLEVLPEDKKAGPKKKGAKKSAKKPAKKTTSPKAASSDKKKPAKKSAKAAGTAKPKKTAKAKKPAKAKKKSEK
jgi:large subunit ribosomal protein L17